MKTYRRALTIAGSDSGADLLGGEQLRGIGLDAVDLQLAPGVLRRQRAVTHQPLAGAKIQRTQSLCSCKSSLHLAILCNAILQVEDHSIHFPACSFLHLAHAVTRHKEQRPAREVYVLHSHVMPRPVLSDPVLSDYVYLQRVFSTVTPCARTR